MDKSEFIQLVQQELDNIKEKATPGEISRLNLSGFDHTHYRHCIYGQMTGNCASDRAKELQIKTFSSLDGTGFDPDSGQLIFVDQNFKRGGTFTALEKYLFMVKRPKHKEIIKYLKGKTETINLNVI